MSVFDHTTYKVYLRDRMAAQPRRGRGESLRLATLLRVHSSMISHVLKGSAHFSVEQGLKIASDLKLGHLETEYFVTLIQHERAGDQATAAYFRTQLAKLKERFLDLSERLNAPKVLSSSDQATFYSQWYYLGIQILTSIEGWQSPEVIAGRLRIPIDAVNGALEFLTSRGLCVRAGAGYRVGITRTFVGRDSPLVSRHHGNWRMRTMQQFPDIRRDEVVYTCPTSISLRDFARVREKLVSFIAEFDQIIAPSPDEEFACLNIDWVKIR